MNEPVCHIDLHKLDITTSPTKKKIPEAMVSLTAKTENVVSVSTTEASNASFEPETPKETGKTEFTPLLSPPMLKSNKRRRLDQQEHGKGVNDSISLFYPIRSSLSKTDTKARGPCIPSFEELDQPINAFRLQQRVRKQPLKPKALLPGIKSSSSSQVNHFAALFTFE